MNTDKNDVAAAKKLLVTDGKVLFPHILLYNSLVNTGEAAEGINALSDIYANLMVGTYTSWENQFSLIIVILVCFFVFKRVCMVLWQVFNMWPLLLMSLKRDLEL